MLWSGKRYRSFSHEMKEIFGEKILKLSLDGGFSCPNRDGKVGSQGCIFCGEEGAGEFAGSRDKTIREQMKSQKELLASKWHKGKYIAFFQSFTNTYSHVDDLREKYNLAIKEEGVVGIAIATRPDCLSQEVLDLLCEINKKSLLWIELGLQTIHEESGDFIRRGYSLDVYDKAIKNLKEKNIRVVTHLIIGLPNESKKDIMNSVAYVARTRTWGIKLHSLYIQKGTDLHFYYEKNPFKIMSKDEYVDIIIEALEILPQDMVVHRITGDCKRDLLIEPKWSSAKRRLLGEIDREFKIRKTYQGRKFNNL